MKKYTYIAAPGATYPNDTFDNFVVRLDLPDHEQHPRPGADLHGILGKLTIANPPDHETGRRADESHAYLQGREAPRPRLERGTYCLGGSRSIH